MNLNFLFASGSYRANATPIFKLNEGSSSQRLWALAADEQTLSAAIVGATIFSFTYHEGCLRPCLCSGL